MAKRRGLMGAVTVEPENRSDTAERVAERLHAKKPPATQEREVKFSTLLPSSLHRRLKMKCAEDGMKLKDFIREAIEEKLGETR